MSAITCESGLHFLCDNRFCSCTCHGSAPSQTAEDVLDALATIDPESRVVVTDAEYEALRRATPEGGDTR